jgi:hypothetical protein
MIRTRLTAIYVIALATACFTAPGAALAEGAKVKVPRTIGFTAESGASDKVKAECKLETKVTHFLNSFSSQVELVDGNPGKQGRTLHLEISEVHAPGGGAWSGAKSMSVKGTLRENGKKVASFTAKRFSGGGFLGGYKGTCSIIGRCAKVIGKDIAKWLENPKDGAHLGDG